MLMRDKNRISATMRHDSLNRGSKLSWSFPTSDDRLYSSPRSMAMPSRMFRRFVSIRGEISDGAT